MDTVILSFHTDDDEGIEFEAVVDTLDPICAVIDGDDEPEVPEFAGWIVHDSAYGAEGDKHAFMVDYGPEEDEVPIDPAQVEAVTRNFLAKHYGVSVQSFGPLPPAPQEDTLSCHGGPGR